jgi:hypothetical protein
MKTFSVLFTLLQCWEGLRGVESSLMARNYKKGDR